MEYFSGDTEGSTDDIPGRKKFKLKSLKNRLFGRSKRGGEVGDAKLSQSASDITAEKGPGSEEDLACSQAMMGSRALSADSIFLGDQVLADAEPAKVISQENVHGKIKALQMKLQQQKMHLGPPPLVLPVRRAEDLGSRSEDDGPAHGLREIPEALSKTRSEPSSRPLSPLPNPAPIKSVPPSPSHPSPPSVASSSSSTAVELLLDLNSPVQFTPCLDTSAARHRMSVRPKNQRARPKKTPTANDSNEQKSAVQTLNNINCPASAGEEEQQVWTEGELILEKELGEAVIVKSQHLPSKPPEVAPISSEAACKSSIQPVPEPDQALLGIGVSSAPSQVLRVKPHRPAAVRPSDRPHSSFMPSELKDNKDRDSEVQAMSLDKRKPPNKVGVAVTSCEQLSSSFGSSPVHQHVQSEKESARGLTRPAPGSGSFHISMTAARNRDAERPRSGSFIGVLQHIEARQKAEEQQSSSMREKEELRGGPFAVGRLGQAAHKTSGPWDRKESLKHVEPVTPSPNVTTDTSAAARVEQPESNQEVVEEAVEAQEVEEDEGKPAFGVKLRSTSLSTRFRSDSSPNHRAKPVYEEQCDQLKKTEIGDLESKDLIPSGYSLPVRHNKLPTDSPHTMATQVQNTSSNLKKEVETSVQELQPAPQTTSPEVSWMSMAMEKTRTLQQLFSNRFPRDFPGVQTTARPQEPVQTETPAGGQEQTPTVKLQQSTTTREGASQSRSDAAKAETVTSGGQTKAVKPSPALAVQQKTPPLQSREPQALKPTGEPVFPAQSVQSNPWTTQSPLHSCATPETSSQAAQEAGAQPLAQFYLPSGQQQPPRCSRGVHAANQIHSTSSYPTTSSASSHPSVSAPGSGERDAALQEKDDEPPSGRRAVWAGSAGEKAYFLEKRAEWTTPPGIKGVDSKKVQTEEQTSGESPVKPLNKDIEPVGRQGAKLAESGPTKVPERPREDKWLRKNAAPSSSPSSSPTRPSALHSATGSGQPSWMELAKRKSMAWSDKSMD